MLWDRFIVRTRSSFNVERGDCLHHAAADTLIGLAIAGHGFFTGEAERFADDYSDFREAQGARALWKRVVGAEDAHGQNGSESLCDDEANARAGGLKVSIP